MTQQRDSVLYFDGDADYVKVSDNQALQVGSYTVEVWLKADGVPDEVWKGIVGKAGPNYNIWLKNTGAIAHRFHTTAGPDIGPETDDGVVKWGIWQHIAITNDGNKAKIYVDGKLETEESVNEPLVIDKTPLIIGAIADESSLTNDLKGYLTEVRLWNKARSNDEIKNYMFHRLTGGEQGLVGYWPLNSIDNNNNVADQSGNENNGKVYGAIIEGQLPFIGEDEGPDKRQYILKFDNSYFNTGSFSMSSKVATVCCWAKSDSATWDGSGLVSNYSSGIGLQPQKGKQELWFLVSAGGWHKTVCDLASINIDITQWHHYAGTYDGQSIRLYVDGEEVSSTVHDGEISSFNGNLYAGYGHAKAGSTSGAFTGKITDVQVWSEALNGSEIKNKTLHRLTGKEEGLQLYWPLDEGQGTVANDKTSNGKNANIPKKVVWDEQFPLAIPAVETDKSAAIKNTALGLVADVVGGTAYPGADVWGWWSNDGAGQKWTITPDGVIKTYLGNYALDLGELPDGGIWVKNVIIKPVDGSATQQWEILPNGVIKNKGNNFVMTMEDYGDFQKLIWAWNPVALGDFNESNPPAKAKWELIDI